MSNDNSNVVRPFDDNEVQNAFAFSKPLSKNNRFLFKSDFFIFFIFVFYYSNKCPFTMVVRIRAYNILNIFDA